MARLLDLHIHPSLKMYYLPYLRASFHAHTYTGPIWNPLSFRSQYKNLKSGPVKVMVCAHYVIERDMVKNSIKPWGRAISWLFAPSFFRKLHRADPYKTVTEMMNLLERAEKNTNRWVRKGGKRLKMVKNFGEINHLADDEIGLIHAIEGSHALGYGPEKGQDLEAFWRQTENRLDRLADRGVCMITLAHFCNNMFGPQTEATETIPKIEDGKVVAGYDDLMIKFHGANWHWDDPGHLAERFTRKLLELGIVVDVSHLQEHARWRVYDLCKEANRPVVATHVGLKHFFNHEYNMSDAEILKIRELDGVVGLILSRRLLTPPVRRHFKDGGGIPELIENMKYIRDLTGDVEVIGIGTDLDGLTHPFPDCYNPSMLDNIVEAMRKDFSEDEIDRIFYRNSERLLRLGWGRRS